MKRLGFAVWLGVVFVASFAWADAQTPAGLEAVLVDTHVNDPGLRTTGPVLQAPALPAQAERAPMVAFTTLHADSTPVQLDGGKYTLGQIRAAVRGLGPAQAAAETNRRLAVERLEALQKALAYQVAAEKGELGRPADVIAALMKKNPTLSITPDLTATVR
jgi:hypothetical protein